MNEKQFKEAMLGLVESAMLMVQEHNLPYQQQWSSLYYNWLHNKWDKAKCLAEHHRLADKLNDELWWMIDIRDMQRELPVAGDEWKSGGGLGPQWG